MTSCHECSCLGTSSRRRTGRARTSQWRLWAVVGVDLPGFSDTRHKEHCKHLNWSPGIVSHDGEQWAVQDSVRAVIPGGVTEIICLKKGL
eukprot:4899-Pyramimonas_sp.AAC.1